MFTKYKLILKIAIEAEEKNKIKLNWTLNSNNTHNNARASTLFCVSSICLRWLYVLYVCVRYLSLFCMYIFVYYYVYILQIRFHFACSLRAAYIFTVRLLYCQHTTFNWFYSFVYYDCCMNFECVWCAYTHVCISCWLFLPV